MIISQDSTIQSDAQFDFEFFPADRFETTINDVLPNKIQLIGPQPFEIVLPHINVKLIKNLDKVQELNLGVFLKTNEDMEAILNCIDISTDGKN